MIQLKIVNDRRVMPGDILLLKVRDIYQVAPGKWTWNVELLDLMLVKDDPDQEEQPK